jgi:ATP/maltotriose-dependent transcriptional regulator MalT
MRIEGKSRGNNGAAISRIALPPWTVEEARAIRPRDSALGAAMLSELAWREIGRSLKLSSRELQIVRAMFDDRKESAIAAELGVASRTVHTHIERLYRKLVVNDRLQLTLRVIREFLALTMSPQGDLPPICANRAAGRCPLAGSACHAPDCFLGGMI